MFQPRYTITPALLANITRITQLVTELNHKHFPRVVLLDFERKAREISVHSSTSIEGNPLPLTEVKRIMKQTPSHIRDSEREVLNYNKALEYLHVYTNQNKNSFGVKLILSIQKIVTEGLVSKFHSGLFRQEPVFVNNPQTQQTIFFPPDHDDVPLLVTELIQYVHDNTTKINPLILAGIFHKQFVIIHPFVDGNGRTTRLATKVLLAAMGLDTFQLFSFEKYYNQNVTKYFAQVGLVGNYYDLKNEIDFTAWLEYFTDGIIDELLQVGNQLSQRGRTPEIQLQLHHHQVLEYIKKNSFMKDSDYATFTTRAKPTRNIDLNKLIDLGLIERKGKGKATYYVLKEVE